MSDPRDGPSGDESILALLSRAVADAEQVARAEIELQKARLAARIAEARLGVVLLVGALVTGSLALTGSVVGVLLILTASLGPIWATVIVVGVLLSSAALLGWLGVRHFRLMFAPAEPATEISK